MLITLIITYILGGWMTWQWVILAHAYSSTKRKRLAFAAMWPVVAVVTFAYFLAHKAGVKFGPEA